MADPPAAEPSGGRFERTDLRGLHFEECDFRGARLHNCDLRGVKMSGAWIDVDLNGLVEGLLVNGVDVAPFVEAELDRRHPERPKFTVLETTDADGFRDAWAVIERRWPETVERARRLAPDQLHERVDGEWSFIETLRHLVFVTDAWLRRAIDGDPTPWHELDLPHDEDHEPSLPRDRSARPSLDEMLALRADRMASVRSTLDALTDEQLAGTTTPVLGPGYPPSEAWPVRRCLRAVVAEEWEHRLFAERDLAVLEGRA